MPNDVVKNKFDTFQIGIRSRDPTEKWFPLDKEALSPWQEAEVISKYGMIGQHKFSKVALPLV